MSTERRDYAILISLSMREEAEVLASALRADGVDAFVGDTNHQGMVWFYTLALGGLQVFVPRNRIEDAKVLIRARLIENADNHPEERVERRDRWKLWLTAGLLYGVNAYWMYFDSMYWAPADKYHPLEWIAGVTAGPAW